MEISASLLCWVQFCAGHNASPAITPVQDISKITSLEYFDLKIAVQLLKSTSNCIIMYAGLTIYHLATLPGLREPFGEAGAVDASVAVVRR
jgi:hypothetical protein